MRGSFGIVRNCSKLLQICMNQISTLAVLFGIHRTLRTRTATIAYPRVLSTRQTIQALPSPAKLVSPITWVRVSNPGGNPVARAADPLRPSASGVGYSTNGVRARKALGQNPYAYYIISPRVRLIYPVGGNV